MAADQNQMLSFQQPESRIDFRRRELTAAGRRRRQWFGNIRENGDILKQLVETGAKTLVDILRELLPNLISILDSYRSLIDNANHFR